MRIVGWVLFATAALFGILVAARMIAGPLSFPVPIHSALNIESFCGVSCLLALAIRTGRDRFPAPQAGHGMLPYIAGIAVLVAVAFWRAVDVYFLADDFILVKMVNAFRPSEIPALLTTAEGSAFFRPVVRMSMALMATWAKFDPRSWHLIGLTIHLLNSILVFVLASRLRLSRSGAFFAGALFAIHGSTPESVIWVTGEYGLIATLFVLCGLLAFLAYLRECSARWWYGAASLACMVLAFLTKETAYVFPLLAVLLVLSERVPLRKAAWILLLFVIVASILFAYRWMLIGGIGGYRDLSSGGSLFTEQGILPIAKSLLLRLWAILYFSVNWSTQPGIAMGAACAAYVAALLWLSKPGGTRLPLLFPLGFLLLAALPPIQQLLIGADLQKARALYLPAVGFSLMLATAIEPLGKRARWMVPAAILLFHFAALQHNLTAWRRAGEAAKSTCAAAARCVLPGTSKLSVWNLPGSLDGVYFMDLGFRECVQLQNESALEVEIRSGNPPSIQSDSSVLLWDNIKSELRCIR